MVKLDGYATGKAYPFFGQIQYDSEYLEGKVWNYSKTIYFKPSNVKMASYRYGYVDLVNSAKNIKLPSNFYDGTDSVPCMGEAIFTRNKMIVLYRADDNTYGPYGPREAGSAVNRYEYLPSKTFSRYYYDGPGSVRPWQPRS